MSLEYKDLARKLSVFCKKYIADFNTGYIFQSLTQSHVLYSQLCLLFISASHNETKSTILRSNITIEKLFNAFNQLNDWNETDELKPEMCRNLHNIITSILGFKTLIVLEPHKFKVGSLELKREYSLASCLSRDEIKDAIEKIFQNNKFLLVTTTYYEYVITKTNDTWVFYNPVKPVEKIESKNLDDIVVSLFTAGNYEHNENMPIGFQSLGFDEPAKYPSRTNLLNQFSQRSAKPYIERVALQENWSPLHIAASINCQHSMKYYLNLKLNPNTLDAHGEPPIYYATRAAQATESAETLVDFGARPPMQTQWLAAVMFEYAAESGNLAYMREIFSKYPSVINLTAALSKAAFYDKVDVVKWLLANGADIRIVDEDGWAPLIGAVMGKSKDSFLLLCNHMGFSFRTCHSLSDPYMNPIFHITQTGNTDLLELFLQAYPPDKAKIIVNIRSPQDRLTPLMVASLNGHEEMTRTLLRYGADITCKDRDDNTAIDFASKNGKQSIIKLLEDFIIASQTSLSPTLAAKPSSGSPEGSGEENTRSASKKRAVDEENSPEIFTRHVTHAPGKTDLFKIPKKPRRAEPGVARTLEYTPAQGPHLG